jgi:hypothetical protein
MKNNWLFEFCSLFLCVLVFQLNKKNALMLTQQDSYYIETAVESLKTAGNLDIELNLNPDKDIDGFLTLFNQTFPIEAKKEFRLNQIAELKQLQKAHPNLILIAEILSDNTKTALKANNINYLDTVGNTYIQQQTGLIWLNSKKRIPKPELNKDKAFTKKGIVLVFHFLNDEHLLNRTYRQISEVTNTSLDTITKVLESLKQQGFLFQKNDKTLVLLDKKRLFEKWADAYDSRLKPHLFVGNFRFSNQEAENNWQKTPFNPTTIWGGEPASDILTNYLQPEIYTLYSSETKAELIKNYRILPDPKGNIHLYMPFTIFENGITSKEFPNAATPLLVYADMLNSNSGRNHEVAQLIYEKYVKQLFE